MSRHRLLLLPVLVLLAALALVACGSSDESDEDKIVDVITSSATSTDPADCEALNTLAFLEQTEKDEGQAALKGCEETAEEADDNPDEVTVSEVEIDGSGATALAAFEGGSLNGQTLEVSLVEEDGDWKLDRLERFTEFDQPALVEGMIESFEQDGELNEEQVSCIGEAFEEASEAELENLFIDGSLEELIELVGSCG